MGKLKVSIDLAGNRIEVDGPKADMMELLQAVKEAFPLIKEISVKSAATIRASIVPETKTTDHGRDLTKLSDFVKGLTLKNSYEQIATLAYFNDIELKERPLSLSNLRDLFIVCDFKMPRSMSDQCVDANRYRKYVEVAGRGLWKVGPGGINFVRELLKTQTIVGAK